MTRAQKIALKQSENREQLGELLDLEVRSEEQAAKLKNLTGIARNLESDYQAAVFADGPEPALEVRQDDAEGREMNELRSRVHFSDYVQASLEMRSCDGAAREFNQAHNIAGNHFPMEFLAPDSLETRATTDVEPNATPKRWIDRLLADTAASRIGMTTESVGAGVASYPITTAGATGKQYAREADTSITAWTVSSVEAKPKRNSVHAEFSIEDLARIPGIEAALVRDLRMGVVEKFDRSVFLGDSSPSGTGYDIVGLTTAASVIEKTLTQASKVKAPETLKEFVELVDGIHAVSMADLRIVSSVGANTLWYTTVANSGTSNQTVAQFLQASGMNWTVRGSVETNTANGDWGAFIGRARNIAGAGVIAVWSNGELIRDPYTKSRSGEVTLTLNFLGDVQLVRPSSFARLKYVT